MSSSNSPEIVFLPVLTTKHSVRQNELVRAGVRAHTARLIHQRRKQKQQQGQLKQPPAISALPTAADLYKNLFQQSKIFIGLSGSSDPFQSFPIEITPEINHVITLARDVLLPNLYIPSYVRRLSFGVAKDITFDRAQFSIAGSCVSADLNQFKYANEGVAAAWLSGHIAFLASLGYRLPEHDISLVELRLRTRSLEFLRRKLSKSLEREKDHISLAIQHIMLLFQADCKRRDSESAAIHGPILMSLVEKLADDTKVAQHLIVMMFGYAELATSTLARPVITLNPDMMKRLNRFWASTSSLVQLPETRYQNVHPTIDNDILRTVFVRLRACLTIAETPLPVLDAPQKARGIAVYAWIATQTFNDMCVLLNLYHDLMGGMPESKTPGQRLTEACTALSLLHTLRKSIHEAEVDGKDLREASHIILPRLQETLENALEVITPEEYSHYAEVYLWIFFTGAQNEQRHKQEVSCNAEVQEESCSMWFNGIMADQARYLNVNTWADMRRILECFVYDRHLTPTGDLWFQESIMICDENDVVARQYNTFQ
jgi:hypothetical protein